MEVWSGSIEHNSISLRGLRFIDPVSTGHCTLSKNAKLSIRSFVRPNFIPLFSFIGPTLEVHITERATAEWIKNKLLGTFAGDDNEGSSRSQSIKQCPAGILLRLEEQSGCTETNALRQISDILIYGILSPSPRHPLQTDRPLTPPPSSTRLHDKQNQPNKSAKELRIYAAPLCSSLITKAQTLPSPPHSPRNKSRGVGDNGQFASFLPDLRSPSPKRKRVATLFEAADEYHRKVRRRGPIAVSEFITRGKSVTPQFPQRPSTLKLKREANSPFTPGEGTIEDSQFRSHLTSNSKNGRFNGSKRPLSRIGSTRSRSDSISSRMGTPTDSGNRLKPVSQRQPQHEKAQITQQNTSPEDVMSTNKALLTRTILTCMRLYGFHRMNTRTTTSSLPTYPSSTSIASTTPTVNTKPHRQEIDEVSETQNKNNKERLPSVSTPSLPAGSGRTNNSIRNTTGKEAASPGDTEQDEDKEFKEMYHATYRASSFALRRFLKTPLVATGSDTGSSTAVVPTLTRDKVMNIVDSVLKLFCEGVEEE